MGDVELRVGDNFTLTEDAVLGATGDVLILADYLNADLGEGVLVDIRNNIDSPTIHIDTADDEDQIELSRYPRIATSSTDMARRINTRSH